MDKIRVLVADDHLVVREGISAIIARQPDIEVVGEAADGAEAVEKALALKPDVILMDLRMPVLDGASAMKQIRMKDKDVKFIVLTTYDTEEYIFQAIEAGAQAYLLKDALHDDLFRAIRDVFQDKSVIEPAIASRILKRFTEMSRQVTPPDALSDREIEVLKLMSRGASNKEIAGTLSLSESTVRTHIQSIFQKMEANNRTEAVIKAVNKGIIEL
jgi:DNA-binding NarL/FixJ family response regulator